MAGPQPGFFEGNEPIETSVRISDEGYESTEESEWGIIVHALFMAMLVLAITIFCVFCREERDGTVRGFNEVNENYMLFVFADIKYFVRLLYFP